MTRTRRGRLHRPHASDGTADSRCGSRRARPCRRTSAMEPAAATRTEDFITAQLMETRLAASFIVDGHHLPDEFLRRALEAKGARTQHPGDRRRRARAVRPGTVHAGRRGRRTTRGRPRHAAWRESPGRLSLRMDHAIENVMRTAGLSLVQAITLATTNPARVGRVRARLQGLRRGERADVVRFRRGLGRIEVVDTWVGGKRAFGMHDDERLVTNPTRFRCHRHLQIP